MILPKSRFALRTVALFEATKALVVLLAGLGVLALIHRDVQAIAEHLVQRLHFYPDHHYPHIFLEAASRVTDEQLWFTAGLALVYTIVRGIEAWGLWYERKWAEWFALCSGGLYLPVEIYELIHHATWFKLTVLLTNIAIVVFMAWMLKQSQKAKSSSRS